MLLVVSLADECLSQKDNSILTGKVTFITSTNVYVRFDNTQNIAIGDTLWQSRNGKLTPVLRVSNKSSSSCVASGVGGYEATVGDLMIHRPAIHVTEPVNEDQRMPPVTEIENRTRQGKAIRGSISASSYSSISSIRDDLHRTMYRLSLRAPAINNSKFSFETYLNYRQTFISSDSFSLKKQADIFDVYNLSVRYNASPTLSFTVGRKINSSVSSIGAIDGLQAEKFFGSFYTGVIVGFRPDILDYKFNSDLLQYGGYIGIKTDSRMLYSLTTLGVLEQTNNGEIDRRYMYFQHSSTINGKLNLFSSLELDLYSLINGTISNEPRLTNLFVSAGYRFSRKVDITLSYDTRKQILYYETLKTEIERLLDDDFARQGLRARLNVRPVSNLGVGIIYSKRFQSNDMNNSDNFNGYLSYSKIPKVGGRLNVNYNRNTSNYMRSNILSFSYSRTLIDTKLDGDFYYRMAGYYYYNSEVTNEQKYYGASLSYWLSRKLVFSVLGELADRASEENNYRVNARIIKNF